MPCSRTLAITRTTLFKAREDTNLDDLLSLIMPRKFFPKDARNFKQYLVFSVLPAPDSPLMTID